MSIRAKKRSRKKDMVQLFALIMVKTKELPENTEPQILAGYVDIPWTVKISGQAKELNEMSVYFSRFFAKKIREGEVRKVEHMNKVCYIIARKTGLTGILISDTEYKSRIAFDIIENTMDKFESNHGNYLKKCGTYKDFGISKFNRICKETMDKYQDPSDVDEIEKCKIKLKDTKEVLTETLEKMIERTGKLEDTAEKCSLLDEEGDRFIRITKRSKCCTIL